MTEAEGDMLLPAAATGHEHAQTKSRAVSLYHLFRVSNDARRSRWPTWLQLDAKTAIQRELLQGYAHFLVHEFIIEEGMRNEGRPLSVGSVLDYINALLAQLADRFEATGDDSVKLFFTCRETKSTGANAQWLKRLRNNVLDICMERAIENGDELDNSVSCIFLQHIRAMSKAYQTVGDRESIERILSIMTLWRAAGRASETAGVHVEALKNELFFEANFLDIGQTKTKKAKKVVFLPGIDRYSDWNVLFGDHLAMRAQKAYVEGIPDYLFPSLKSVKYPGTKIGEFMRALKPRDEGGSEGYKQVAIDGSDVGIDGEWFASRLPADTCAGGIRPGTINMLTTAMPAEFVCHATGQELKSLTSMFEYVDANLALCMPSGVMLAGWNPFPYGHLGRGPSQPSLSVLAVYGETSESLQPVIDTYFQLNTASSPTLLQGGRLRPLIYAAFASTLMYFEDSVRSQERPLVIKKLVAVMRKTRHDKDAANTLAKWGREVAKRFATDNGRLTSTGAAVEPGGRGEAEALRALGAMVGELRTSVKDLTILAQDQATEIRAIKQALRAGTSTASSSLLEEEVIEEEEGEELEDSMGELSPGISTPFLAGFGSLLPFSGSAVKVTDSTAPMLFAEWCESKGKSPAHYSTKGDRSRGNNIFEWFCSAAQPSEKDELVSGNMEAGAMVKCTEMLHSVVRQGLATEFKRLTGKVPPCLGSAKVMAATTLETQLRTLKKLREGSEFTPEVAALLSFRKVRCPTPPQSAPQPVSLFSLTALLCVVGARGSQLTRIPSSVCETKAGEG